MRAGAMSSKRKTSAPTKVLVDDTDAVTVDHQQQQDQASSSPAAAVNHDVDEDSMDLEHVSCVTAQARGVLVDTDSCSSHVAVDQARLGSSPAAALNHDVDEDSVEDRRSLRVVTSPSSLCAPEDDDNDVISDDVTRDDVTADVIGDVTASGRQWLSREVGDVLRRIELIVSAAGTLDERRRRVDEMLGELETIRRHLLTAAATQSDTTDTSTAAAASLSPVCVITSSFFN